MTPERFAMLSRALRRRQPSLTVLMESVHKPHNYSAILRSCDAVGALDAHAITSHTTAWRAEVNKSQAGASAAKWVRVHIHDSIRSAADHLRAGGFRIIATHRSDKSCDFREIDLTAPVAVLVGTELHGLTTEAAGLADNHVEIPMMGVVESLNVSVATAVVLFEAQRQRRAAGMYDKPQLAGRHFDNRLFEWAHPRVAGHCRSVGAPYPALDDCGEIVGDFPR